MIKELQLFYVSDHARISETVRRHYLDAEEVGEQKRMKGSFSNYNSSTYGSINQSQMALVRFVVELYHIP